MAGLITTTTRPCVTACAALTEALVEAPAAAVARYLDALRGSTHDVE